MTQEVDPLKLPEQEAVPESVADGASGGATKDNLGLPTAVRRDAGTEGGVKSLPKDPGPSTPPSKN
ncbi:hypothetical protein HY339_00280 [Candidatus Gottesmanbacteria bacterium]|nr:hypothetical protein [Candidatus Gottesmanbacteria bacterium]